MSFSWGSKPTQFFFGLTPDRVLDAVETAGLQCTGRCTPMNSMENRVYDVEIEVEKAKTVSDRFRIAKFYRPGRWSREQIMEEHHFLLQLQEQEIPVIAPLKFQDGTTLKTTGDGIHYTLFPRVGGRSPDEFTDDQLERVGRLLARIHNVGAFQTFQKRIHLDAETYGDANLDFLLDDGILPQEFSQRFEDYAETIIQAYDDRMENIPTLRLHGDCHLGNLLWNEKGPFFLDFDDAVMGPAIQDLWLVCRGRDEESRRQFEVLLGAYRQMRTISQRELSLVEPLRGLRIIHLCAWIAKRWNDPAFPLRFPQFGSREYWENQTDALREVVEYLN